MFAAREAGAVIHKPRLDAKKFIAEASACVTDAVREASRSPRRCLRTAEEAEGQRALEHFSEAKRAFAEALDTLHT